MKVKVSFKGNLWEIQCGKGNNSVQYFPFDAGGLPTVPRFCKRIYVGIGIMRSLPK
jgi:hypothetical protein